MHTFTAAAIAERKNAASRALAEVLKPDQALLVFAGDPVQRPGGLDQCYPFIPHPDYYWISGFRRHSGVSAFCANEGWIDFVSPISNEERIWEGVAEAPALLSKGAVRDVGELTTWLDKNRFRETIRLGSSPSGESTAWTSSKPADEVISEVFHRVRRRKDTEEVALIRRIAGIAKKGYERIGQELRPGLTERQIQLSYEFEVLKSGAEALPYQSIVGTGTRSAVLHAIPSERMLNRGDLVLIDAGAEVANYCVDITRVFIAGDQWNLQQKALASLVLKAQRACIEICRPGVEWKDVHLKAARILAEGLKDLGILKIDAEVALETGAIALFFPHGVGHMVGLHVRDVGGPRRREPKRYAGASLRVDMKLEENHVMTVEPGLYFIDTILDNPANRAQFSQQVNWNELEKWKGFGGVRIEDDILVTNSNPEILTECVPLPSLQP